MRLTGAERRARTKQSQVELEKMVLLREELRECALREGVNSIERCAHIRDKFLHQAQYARGHRSDPPSLASDTSGE
jgi:hypothetical protein